jgi:hypothetical protein
LESERNITAGLRAKADPRPCDRCRHRRDVHEVFRGLRYCRACEWIGQVWPCSTRTLELQKTLDALSFELAEAQD